MLCELRRKGGLSEDEIAAKLGFGSAEAMRMQLKNWEIPDWLVPEKAAIGENDTRKRRARRGEGEAIELPPAEGAVELFNEALKAYAEDVVKLKLRKEYFKDERFVVTHEYPPETKSAGLLFRREKLSAVEWDFFCSMYGKDPDTIDEFEVYHTTYLERGASQSPPEPLPRLIAMYALAGLPLDPLLEKLHHVPEDVNREQLQRQINYVPDEENPKPVGLIPQAQQLAKLVRGRTSLRTGRNTGELSALEHAAIKKIIWHRQNIEVGNRTRHFRDPRRKTHYLKQLEKKMYEDLHEFYGFSKSEVDRLEKLRLTSQRHNYREDAP